MQLMPATACGGLVCMQRLGTLPREHRRRGKIFEILQNRFGNVQHVIASYKCR